MDKMKGTAAKRARISAGLTQEKAAEMAGYSVDAIQGWESGSRRCSVEVLDALAVIYNAPWLPAIYLRELSRGSMAEIMPGFTPGRPLSQAALALIYRLNALADRGLVGQLTRIASDGRVDEEEKPVFDAIVAELIELTRAANELRFAKGEEGTT